MFDAAAVNYHLYRPGYPDSIIAQMIALSGISAQSRLLEIGCGTGQATALLASRGYAIDCLDPGESLIAVAREVCRDWPRVAFIVGRFEEIELPEHSYDLVYSAQAFHWVDPRVRWAKCDQCLVEGGSLALIYNYSPLEEGTVQKRFSDLIGRESGGALQAHDHETAIARWVTEIAASGHFGDVTVRRQKWIRRYQTEEYIGLFGTFSDYLSLSQQARERIAHTIRDTLSENGGCMDHGYETVLLHARKKPAITTDPVLRSG
jgi:SAM-dependent methyltransferase